MNDVFLEHIVKKAPETKSSLLKVGLILAAIVSSYIIMNLVMTIPSLATYSSFFLLLVAGIIYGAYRIITGFNCEYEYIVTNGELDVDKIAAKRTRKRLVTLRPVDVELMAPYNDANRAQYNSGQFAQSIDASSSKYAPNLWFVIAATQKYGRVRLIFEPTEKMVENMRSHMPRKVQSR